MNVGTNLLRMVRYPCVFTCIWLIAGCATVAATVPAQPFQQFQQSIAQLKVSADEALAVEQDLVYQRYLAQWREEGEVTQLQLLQGEDGTPFSMQLEEAPLYRDIQIARSNLESMNSLVLQYANTLLLLTGSTDDSPNVDADELASNLRTNANNLVTTLGSDVDIPNGLFFGFGVIAKNYVESKRQDLLIQLIDSSQPSIQSLAMLGQQITQLSGLGIQVEYAVGYSNTTEGVGEMSESQRGALIERVLALNEQTLRQLDSLKLVHDAFGALPATHLKLQQSVIDGTSLSFTELLTYVEALKTRYEEFKEE